MNFTVTYLGKLYISVISIIYSSALNETVPIVPCILISGAQLVDLGRIRKCVFVGGGMPLGLGFELSKPHAISR